jgi:hypothetical protein
VPAPDPATFTIAIGPGATRLELPVEASDAVTGSSPQWPEPATGTPAAQLASSGPNSVERDLDDAWGRYRQARSARFALEAGGELTWDAESSAWVARDDPGKMRLETTAVWRIVDGAVPIEIRTQFWQTFDEQQVHAEIDVDGQRFFERDWNLRFDAYPWRIQR